MGRNSCSGDGTDIQCVQCDQHPELAGLRMNCRAVLVGPAEQGQLAQLRGLQSQLIEVVRTQPERGQVW